MNFKENNKCFIIAELSANHNQDIELAKETIRAMKESGADAVKVQTYTADTLTIDCDKEHFKIGSGSLWEGKTLYKLYEEAYTPWDWQPQLKKFAEEIGLIFFSTPFDFTAVDFLEDINIPIYKIASFEIQDLPLIEYVAQKQKPVIISTGIAELSDIEAAVKTCRRAGNDQIALLKCTSAYPAPVDEANLRTIPNMAETFNVAAGLSDHTPGISVPVAAVALGAKIVEKHFILDKSIGGPDSAFSLEPDEFKQVVNSIRETEKALGKVTYELSEKSETNKSFGRSLFAVKDIGKSEKLTELNVRSIRPGYGLHPKYYYDVLGKTAAENIERGTPLKWSLLS